MTNLLVTGTLLASVLCSGAGPAAAQAFVLRDDRPLRTDIIYPDSWPNGEAVAIFDSVLHRWTGETWMPVLQPAQIPVILDIAYDRQRDQAICIAFSFVSNSPVTYLLDGSGFQAVPVSTPFGALLQYDPSLGAVMLFTGGSGNTQDYYWQGTWVPLPANVRPFDLTTNMAADRARSRLVAFTQPIGVSPGGQTYEWDGATWTLLTPAASPLPRDGAAMAFDPIASRVLLFGGIAGTTNFTDTWTWDGLNWVSIPTLPNPVPVRNYFLAFDRQRNAVVLLQGSRAAEADYQWNGAGWTTLTRSHPVSSYFQIANDWVANVLVMHLGGTTFRWDGLSWTSLQAGGPSARVSPMAFDVVSQRMVVFGGAQFVLVAPFFQALGDAWTFDGTAWTQQTAGIVPPPRRNHALVAHLGSSGVVLFGGQSTTGAPLQDTWLWSGGSWTQLNLPVAPPPGLCSGSSGPVGADPFVLSGGQLWRFNGTWNVFSTTLPGNSTYVVGTTPGGEPLLISRSNNGDPVYEWVAGTWVARPPSIPMDTTAFDPLRGVTIGFSQGQRYAYTATPAAATTVGSPCGLPAPRMLPVIAPVLGTAAMRIDVDEVRGIAAFFAGFGTANQPIGGGCSVYIASPIALGLASANANDIASLPLPIPSTPTLLGLTIHAQVASPQAGTPPLGLALSDRLTLTLGH